MLQFIKSRSANAIVSMILVLLYITVHILFVCLLSSLNFYSVSGTILTNSQKIMFIKLTSCCLKL